jgi:hypothetical protein
MLSLPSRSIGFATIGGQTVFAIRPAWCTCGAVALQVKLAQVGAYAIAKSLCTCCYAHSTDTKHSRIATVSATIAVGITGQFIGFAAV